MKLLVKLPASRLHRSHHQHPRMVFDGCRSRGFQPQVGLAHRSQDAGGAIPFDPGYRALLQLVLLWWGWGGSGPCRAAVQAWFVPFSGQKIWAERWPPPLGWSSAAGQLGPESAPCGSQIFPTLRAGSEKPLQVCLQERDSLSVSFPDALRSLTPADGLRVVTAGRSPPDRPERRQPRWLGLPNTYQRCVQPGGDPRAGQDTLER